ncbi:hypothetical protein BU15DRAFT_90473 [Melanogaster broomeanus]|nr:hypothetical protein BU15DRAFT_90473 [Melanogaster broomeanus]
MFFDIRSIAKNAESTGGRIRPETIPTSFLGRIVTPIHTFCNFSPSAVYFIAPDWMARFAFSDEVVGSGWKNALRLVAGCGGLPMRGLAKYTFAHLGDQWHVVGRRKKSRIVQTGPYAVVRHPLFALNLLSLALTSVMFWSYVPLVSLGIIAAVFTVKLPIEESVIQQDEETREEYRAYMKKVPSRLIPYIW